MVLEDGDVQNMIGCGSVRSGGDVRTNCFISLNRNCCSHVAATVLACGEGVLFGVCTAACSGEGNGKQRVMTEHSTQTVDSWSDIVLLLLLLLLTAIQLSLCGSSPYTSTDKTNKNKYT
jgi:hypothetical protein